MFESLNFLSAAVVILTYFVTYQLYQFLFGRKAKFARSLPGPKKYPFIGNALDLYGLETHVITKKVHFGYPKIYGSRYSLAFGTRYYFTSINPSDVEKLLSSTTHLNKGVEYKFVMPWLGEGLLTSQGQRWFHRRKMLTPSFHFKILEEFMTVFNEQSEILVKKLKLDCKDGQAEVEISQCISLCTLDIISETAMGKRINAQSQNNSDYVNAIHGLSSVINDRSLNPFYLYDLLWNWSPGGARERQYLEILHGFTNSVIQERKKEIAEARKFNNGKKPVDSSENSDVFMSKKKRATAFMDLLLNLQAENPNLISDEEIREETDTFMFEGHDTSGTSLCWTIFILGCYPDIQEKVYNELEAIFENDKDRQVTTQDLTQMKYLECVLKESLRVYPSVPFIGRELKEDLTLEDGVVIPEGMNYCIFPLQVHRNPEVWPNPEEFNPERFSAENSAGRHPYAYIPFSAGPRNCIGQKFALMEEKVIMAQLLRNFKLQSVGTLEDVILTTELILRSKDGLQVKFVPR